MNELKLLLLKKGIFAIAGLGVFLVLLSSFGGSNNLKHNSSDSIVPSPVSMDDTDIGQTAQTVYATMEKSHQKMLNDEKAFDEKKASILGVQHVAQEDVSKYGVVQPLHDNEKGKLHKIKGIVDKII